jgi:inorganic triphosphatase YgiF
LIDAKLGQAEGSMHEPEEVELKLELEPKDLRRLEQSPLLRDEDEATDRLISHYFDTPEHDLRRAGYTLRVRHRGGRDIQTVKQEKPGAAGLFVRPEWERPIKGRSPRIEESDGPLSALIGGHELELAFTTDVKRLVRNIAVGGAWIEVAFDDGRIRAGSDRAALCELELELKSGVPAPLFALAREMNALVPVRLGVRSKAERGYALADGGQAPAIKAESILLDPAMTAADGFAAIASACIRHFRLNEPLLLETGSAEALHQSRVALRRLRSAFSSFKALLADDPQAEALRQSLRWLAGELGAVRDLDVLIPKLDGADRERLVEARRAAWGEARTALDSIRARELMIDLAEWLAIGAWRTRPADPRHARRPLCEAAADLLTRHRRQLKRRGHDLASLSDHDRHRARIEAKKLRYASEFFASLWTGKRAAKRHQRFVTALETLQDHLGALNDRVIAAELLARHDIASHGPRKGRKRLLRKAERALGKLMDVKPFWA